MGKIRKTSPPNGDSGSKGGAPQDPALRASQHSLPPSAASEPEPASLLNAIRGVLGLTAFGLLIVAIAKREPTADERREVELQKMLFGRTITRRGIAELVQLSWRLAYTGKDWWSLSADERRDFELGMKASWGILTDPEDEERSALICKLAKQGWAAAKKKS